MIFSKFSLNSVKSLCRPHKLATLPCHGCTTQSPLVLYTVYHKFSIFLDMSKDVDQTHSNKHTDSYLPQTNMINKQREFVVYVRIVFLKIVVYMTNGELCIHDMVQLPTCEGDIRISQHLMKTLKNHIS